jgi:eukaryotic-like serine/threonine-protein kinase
MNVRADSDDVEELTLQWKRDGIDPNALRRDDKGSIVAARRALGDPERLPLVAGAEIDVGPVIGEGGNAVVLLGRQASLDRDVAVKKLRVAGKADDARALVHEGLVLGALEHPNIVPVHMLGRDAAGEPLIVLKRVGGVPWSEFMGGGEPLDAPQGADPLAWNLGVLMQVASAVEFAHGRGVVHRDLKPDNVMIGEHGEVYLMDWGSAVRIADDGPAHLPHARDVKGIEGTPDYMAPELAVGRGAAIGAHTDVYLLGACLHEIITGRAPHEAESIKEALYHAFASPPPRFDDGVPPELAAICKTAMSKQPAKRYANVAELRAAIATFLRHRHSAALAREALARAEALERMLRAGDVDRASAYKLFGECWFGFHNALRQHDGNQAAQAGRARAVAAMIGFEIGRRSAEAARTLLDELPEPEPALRERVEALERELAAERRAKDKLARLGQEADTDVARPERRRMVFGLAALYGTVLLAFGAAGAAGLAEPSWSAFAGLLGAYGAALVLAVLRWRSALGKNRANRRFVALLSMTVLLPLALLPLAHAAGVALAFAVGMVSLIHGTLAVCLALLIHWRLAYAAAPFALAFAGAALVPAHAFEIAGAAALACTAVLSYQWRAGDRVRAERAALDE